MVSGSWRSGVAVLSAATALATTAVVPAGAASDSTPEVGDAACSAVAEPNDVLADAVALPATAACATAQPNAGGQDLYVWTVDPAAAVTRWTITATGIPRQASIVAVYRARRDGSGDIVEVERLAVATAGPGEAGSLDGLLWEAGEYVIGVGTSGPGAYRLDITALGDPPDLASEPDPDDAGEQSTPVAGAFAAAGDRAGSDDVYVWLLDAASAQRRWQLDLRIPAGTPGDLIVRDGDGGELARVRADSSGLVSIPDVSLPAGRYELLVPRGSADVARYVLSASPVEGQPGESDAEPNDDAEHAQPLDLVGGSSATVSGRLATVSGHGDADWFAFDVDAATAGRLLDVKLFWRGASRRQLCLHVRGGRGPLRCEQGEQPIAFNDLVLAAGSYRVAVEGDAEPDDPYLLRFDVTAELVGGFEAEPNDVRELSSAMAPDGDGHTGSGRLASTPSFSDTDYFTFTSSGAPQLWEIEAAGAGVSDVRAYDAVAPPVDGIATVTDLYLPAGEHVIEVRGDGDYTVGATPLGPPDPDGELEPNDDATHSHVLHLGGLRRGRLAFPSDRDVYRFSLPAETVVDVRVTPPGDGQYELRLASDVREIARLPGAAPGEPVAFRDVLPAGDYWVTLLPLRASRESYELAVAPLDPFDTGEGAGVDLNWGECGGPVAAYWPERQHVDCALTITNDGDDDVAVDLEAIVGHRAWTVELGVDQLDVAAGDTVEVAASIHVGPDAWADEAVVVAAEAIGVRTRSSAATVIVPSRDAAPIDPTPFVQLPPELLGGLDAASLGLGAVVVGAADERASEEEGRLHDGLSTNGAGWFANDTELPAQLAVELAGDAPVPVAGVVLDLRGADVAGAGPPGEFSLELSPDGEAYAEVLTASPLPGGTLQTFVLDAPAEARFARLEVRHPADPEAPSVYVGEWSVIATPGWSPGGRALEISDPSLGGHIVRATPAYPSTDGLQSLLAVERSPTLWRVPLGERPEVVIGFHHDRAAQPATLTWTDTTGDVPTSAVRPRSAQVAVSLAGPAGPWEPVGDWALDGAGGSPAPFAFPGGTWARFVRVTLDLPQPGEGASSVVNLLAPDVLGVTERAAGDGYLPVVGSWGRGSAGPYEHTVVAAPVQLDSDGGDTAAEATTLPPGIVVTDTAWVGRDDDWYRIAVPPRESIVELTLGGRPSVDVDVALFDANLNEVALEVEADDAGLVTATATVAPGADYLVRVTEPPSSVVFSFDTSGSIGEFHTAIEQGMRQFAADVRAGEEWVTIVPFGRGPLMADWSDDPYDLQAALNAYAWDGSSSDAEGSLTTATDALAEQVGTRAVVLITDAYSGNPPANVLDALWSSLATTRPRVYAVHVVGGSAPSEDLMEDWATVSDGGYNYVTNQGAMDVAFDRIATQLRRPSIYTVQFATSEPPPAPTTTSTTTAAPLPSTLQLLAAPPQPGTPVAAAGDASIAIILDTSGSMLQTLPEGSRRIEAARAALTQLVTNVIPGGTNVSLRVFGDTPDSCDARLIVPQSGLDPPAMASVIANVAVIDGVRTPIGASLHQVAGDLGTAPGPKIVVLVTDGEETCDGDPAAAIESLRATGIDVRINIVGFALDDEALKAQFAEWARLGNGQYIDAGNQAELTAAVSAAVQPTFDIVDPDGIVVVSGQVGAAPLTVPAGTYTVVVHSNPEQRLEVMVLPGQAAQVQLR